jgi:hypothetical protein
MNIWLYHINPSNPSGWEYGWDVTQPESLLESSDRIWPAHNMFRKVAFGDLICVYTKSIEPNPDAVYVVGTVTEVLPETREFRWKPDQARSLATLSSPILSDVVRRFFGRSYGSYMQQLPAGNHREFMQLVEPKTPPPD